MSGRLWWLLVGGLALIGAYEIAAAVMNWPGNDPLTIWQIVWRASKASPVVPFLFGFLMGHFFAKGN